MRIAAETGRPDWLQTSKWQAFAVHLGISAAIVGGVALLTFLVWYPSPYFAATGTGSILLVLVSVDLVVGPLLTAIVFKPGKKGLKLDLSIIAVVQLVALAYGTSVLYQERPYYMVFAIDRFHILAYKDVVDHNAIEAEWMRKPIVGPRTVIAELPKDIESQQALLEETLFGGQPDIEQRPEFWRPFEAAAEDIDQAARQIDLLRAHYPDASQALDEITHQAGKDASEIGFVPVIAKKGDVTAIVDRTEGDLLAVLNVDPWF